MRSRGVGTHGEPTGNGPQESQWRQEAENTANSTDTTKGQKMGRKVAGFITLVTATLVLGFGGHAAQSGMLQADNQNPTGTTSLLADNQNPTGTTVILADNQNPTVIVAG